MSEPEANERTRQLKKESARSSSNEWTELCTERNYFTSYCKRLRDCFKYLLKELIFNNNKCRKQMYETLESAGVMMIKEFLPVHFEIDLLEFPWEVVIWSYFRRIL